MKQLLILIIILFVEQLPSVAQNWEKVYKKIYKIQDTHEPYIRMCIKARGKGKPLDKNDKETATYYQSRPDSMDIIWAKENPYYWGYKKTDAFQTIGVNPISDTVYVCNMFDVLYSMSSMVWNRSRWMAYGISKDGILAYCKPIISPAEIHMAESWDTINILKLSEEKKGDIISNTTSTILFRIIIQNGRIKKYDCISYTYIPMGNKSWPPLKRNVDLMNVAKQLNLHEEE